MKPDEITDATAVSAFHRAKKIAEQQPPHPYWLKAMEAARNDEEYHMVEHSPALVKMLAMAYLTGYLIGLDEAFVN